MNPAPSSSASSSQGRVKKSDVVSFKMHGVFAHFYLPKEFYEVALKCWTHTKIEHQVLPTKVLKFEGRKVRVRIFRTGKVCFIVGATENPIDTLYVRRLYRNIWREFKRYRSNLTEPYFAEPVITRADVHVDLGELPELHFIVPKVGTTISIHKVRGLFRVEVRGNYADAVKTLVCLLGLQGKRVAL